MTMIIKNLKSMQSKRVELSASFHGKVDSLNSFILSESRESIVFPSVSSYSLVNEVNQSQMKKKAYVSEDITISDNIGRTETYLKRSGKHAPHSKSVLGTTIPEIILTNKDRKVSGSPSSPS